MKSNIIYNSLLKHPYQPLNPCYRKKICFAFHSYLNAGNDLNLEKINEMKDRYENWETFFISNKKTCFFNMYPSKGEDLYTLIFKDSDLLLLYKESHSEFNGKPNKTRIEAFNYAIHDVSKNLDEIINIISKYRNKEWCHELEIELEKIFNYKKPNP